MKQLSGAYAAVLTLAAALWAGAASGQSAICADPGGFCGRSVSAACIERLGAGAVPAPEQAGSCQQDVALYRDCLRMVSAQCSGGASSAAARAGEVQAGDVQAVGPYSVSLESCVRKGDAVRCSFKLSHDGSLEEMRLYRDGVLAIGDDGSSSDSYDVWLGSNKLSGSYPQGGVGLAAPAGISVNATFEFPRIDKGAKSLQLLRFAVKEVGSVDFRDVPIK